MTFTFGSVARRGAKTEGTGAPEGTAMTRQPGSGSPAIARGAPRPPRGGGERSEAMKAISKAGALAVFLANAL